MQTQWTERIQHNDVKLTKWLNISDSGQISDECKHTPKASSSPLMTPCIHLLIYTVLL